MLIIPLRATLELNLSLVIQNEVHNECFNILDPHIQDSCKIITRDANILGELRKTSTDNESEDQLTHLLDYLGALLSLTQKTELTRTPFAWVNSLSYSRSVVQGISLWFEILNILLNIAACHSRDSANKTMNEAAHLYQKAAGVLQYAELDIIPRLQHLPPPELSKEVIIFLQELCLTQSADLLASDGSSKWSVSSRYRNLLEQLRQLPIKNREWEDFLEIRIQELLSEACLEVAKSLHRTRRNEDRLLQKASIVKCLEFTTNPMIQKEAESMLKEPFNRRTKLCLIDIETSTQFDPNNYFSDMCHEDVPNYIQFEVPKFDLFQGVLPFRMITWPRLLHEKLVSVVNSSLCTPLLLLNRQIILALGDSRIPVSLELSHSPEQIPSSLMDILTRLTSHGDETVVIEMNDSVTENTNSLKNIFNRCEFDLKELKEDVPRKFNQEGRHSVDTEIVENKLSEVSVLLTNIGAQLERYKDMFDLLSLKDDPQHAAIRKFIGIPLESGRPVKSRTKPFFYTKAEAIYRSIINHVDKRNQLRKDLFKIVSEHDLYAELFQSLESHPSSTIKEDIDKVPKELELSNISQAILNKALLTFSEYFNLLGEEEKIAAKQMSTIKDLDIQRRSYSHNVAHNLEKTRAIQSLIISAVKWSDIENDLLQLKTTLTKIRFLTASSSSTTEATESQATLSTKYDLKSSFCWKPGTRINISS